MIDMENEIFNEVSAQVREQYPDIFMTGEYVKTPPSFPCVSLVEVDNATFRNTQTAEGKENHVAVMYVGKDRGKAVLYAYDIHPRYQEKLLPVKMKGLDTAKRYKVEEINLMPGSKSRLSVNGKVLSGDYLMKAGIEVFTAGQCRSRVVELTEVGDE